MMNLSVLFSLVSNVLLHKNHVGSCCSSETITTLLISYTPIQRVFKKSSRDFPAGPVVKNPPANAGYRFNPSSARIPRASEPVNPFTCALQQAEATTAVRSPCTKQEPPPLTETRESQCEAMKTQLSPNKHAKKLIEISMALVNELNKIRYTLNRLVTCRF